MNLFCPNLSNKQIKREFNQLIEAVGENRAYYLWNKNNGYSLDRTSDGSPSELYQACLDYCNGDENKAIEMKSIIYSTTMDDSKNSFKDVVADYNNYISNKSNANKEASKSIRLSTIFDDISSKLNLDENATASAINGSTIASIKSLVNVLDSTKKVSDDTMHTLRSLEAYDCPIVVEPSLKDDTIAWYDGVNVHLTDKFLQTTNTNDAAKVLLHEYVHVALSHVLNNPITEEEKVLYNSIVDIYNSAKKINSITSTYGMSSVQEFTAEFMSNPSFRNELRSNNFYTRLLNAIKQFFTGNKYQLNTKEYNELADSLQSTIEIGCKNIDYLNGERLPINLYSKSAIPTTTTDYEKYITALRNKITDGLGKRMKSLKFRGSLNNTQLNDLRNEISRLQSLDATESIMEFVTTNMSRIAIDTDEYAQKIQEELNKDDSDISNEDITKYSKTLYDLNADFIGFYNSVYDDIMVMLDSKHGNTFINTLSTTSSMQDMQMLMNSVYEHVNRVKNLFKNMSSILAKKIIQRAYLGLTTVDENGKERLIDDVLAAINWVDSDVNRNPEDVYTYNQQDVWSINSFAGQYSSSNNSLIRIIANEISKGRNKVERHTYVTGVKLKNLLDDVVKQSGIKSINLLQEKDDEGKTTGYFTRELKDGLMYQDMSSMYDSLGKKYDLPTDSYSNYIQPELGDKNFDNYWHDVDNWMDNHVDRRYTKEYYVQQRILGQDAKLALKEINDQVSKLLSKTRSNVSDRPNMMKLTDSEYFRLHKLLIEKKQLGSLYYGDGNKKEGKALEIAEQIGKLNKLTQTKLSYKNDKAGFDKEYTEAKERYKNDSKGFNAWLLRNTQESVPEWFKERFGNEDNEVINAIKNNKELNELKEQEKAILAPFKDVYKLGYNMSSVSLSAKEKLKVIDFCITYLQTKIIHKASSHKTGDNKKRNKMSATRLSPEYIAEYNKQLAVVGAQDFTNSDWYIQNHYETASGESKPLRGWYIFAPPSDEDIIHTSNRWWNELDVENSEYANKQFTSTGEVYQPKKIARYINKDFSIIKSNPKLFTLYKALLNVMQESNDKISFQEKPNIYRLPQISGRMSSILRRSNGKIFDALKFSVDDLVTTHDDDVDYIERQDVRPDGSKIRNIPVRFIKMLKDPSRITSDVVGSIIQFYEMADNYNVMTHEVAPLLETLTEQARIKTKVVNNRGKVESKNEGDTNVYKAIRRMLDMHVYGEKRKPIIMNAFDKEVNVSKILDKFYEYTSMIHLTWNFNTSLVGFATAIGAADTEATLGKYFNVNDHVWAKKEFANYIPSILKNLGNISYRDKMICAMDFNNTTRSSTDMFSKLDQSRLLRFISTHWAYGTYTLGDTAVKGTTTLAVYHSIRLCDIHGNKEFIRREDFLNRFYPKDKKAGNAAFEKSGICLWDAYEVVDGEFKVKPEYSKYVSQEFESKLKNMLEAINVRNDGNISDLDRSGMFAHSLLHYVVQHRNFFMLFQERFKKRQYNFKTGTYEEGYYRGAKTAFTKIFNKRDLFSLNRLRDNYNTLTDDTEKYCTKRVLTDVAFLMTMQALIGLMLLPTANDPDNGDDWFIQEMAYAFEKTRFEMGTYYKPDDVLGLLKSPSASSSDINNIFSILESIVPWNWLEDDPLKPTKTGVYKDVPWLGKQTIKLTPFKNVIEALDAKTIKSKRKYQENQIQNGF